MVDEVIFQQACIIARPLSVLMSQCQELLDSVPLQYRDTVWVDVDPAAAGGYVLTKIHYSRPRTPKESEEARRAQRVEDATRDEELAELARLKRKYP